MSTPSPLPSPGTLDGASSPKSRVRITVLTILALHVVVIGGLLLQGCDKGGKAAGGASNTVSSLPPLVPDTNYFTSFPGDGGAAGSGTTAGGGPGAGAGAAHGAGTPSTAGPTGGAASGNPDAGSQFAGTPGSSTPGGTGAGGFPPITAGTAAAAAAAGQPTEHVIKKGETIGVLAKKYGVTEQAIIDANPQAKPRSLKIDEKLVIPPPTPSTAAAVANATPAVAGEVYLVKQGDTLTKVAKKFGVSVKQLRAANNLRGDRIVPKQRLTIPAKTAAAPSNPVPASGAAPAI